MSVVEEDDQPLTMLTRKRPAANMDGEGGDQDVWKVERLMGKKIIQKKTHYLVKWVGCDEGESTWEPAQNILDRSLIIAFNKSAKENK